MERRPLGRRGLSVSVICLGTMTWGQQNSEAEAHAQLDAAFEAGVNIIDTAEMYPIPTRGETQGRTEACIGSWLAARRNRDRVVLATKVTGRSHNFPYLRGGETRLDRANIEAALEGSLRRLRTDTIDLYQLHWPDRRTNFFGELGYQHARDDESIPLQETLAILGDLVRAGMVRHVGVSNETPWGLMACLQVAARDGLPRVESIQNPYNLVNRSFEVGLAEAAIRESCGLLAYAPLGGGVLTGKYLGGARPPGARLTLFEGQSRYTHPRGVAATERYVALARAHGLDPAQMAIAYVASRPFVTSAIIGATTMAQLHTDMASTDLTLSTEVLAGIEAIHADNPNPSP